MDFIDRLDLHADRPLAVTDDGRTWAYAQVLELAQTFERHGLRGRLVLCICRPDAGSLVGYLALLKAGAVPALFNAPMQPDTLAVLLQTHGFEFIWSQSIDGYGFQATKNIVSFEGHGLWPGPHAQAGGLHEGLTLLLSTSGSTGSPKLVRQSRTNVAHNAAAIAQYLGLTPDERPITTLPMGYTYGLSIIHSHVLLGCTLALTGRSLFDRGFWDFFKSVGATSMGGVPYHYDMLKKLRFFKTMPPSLRTLTQAGGRMPPELALEVAQACAQQGVRYVGMYGQAEATARMSYLLPERAVRKPGSIGQAIPGGELWLEDEHGQRIESPGVVGQLVYQGPNVTWGYALQRADLALGDERHGLLLTGDLAYRDEEGDYHIAGRQQRFLKLFGNRVNLQEVDDWLHAQGCEAVCTGQDDALKVLAVGLLPPQAAALKQRLAAWLKVHPSAVVVCGVVALARTEAGKISFSALNALPAEVLA